MAAGRVLRTILTGSLLCGAVVAASVLGATGAAWAKGTPPPPRPSITTYPIQVVQTADGAVSYRSDGSGSPLVMITGFGAGQDSWPPSLVNALAADHRVIIFDNAGIGQTTMPPGTLTISAMAAQTNAFIQALGLGKPDVLGWSMGGLIAQALAHLYPNDVGRLVLCATLPGNGTAVGPSTSLLNDLLNAVSTDNLGELMPLLFPSDQVSTQGPAYVAALLKYPGFYGASTPVADAQLSAVESWIAGMDSGGNGIITAPTLIGDGADDVLTAPVNSKELHKSISGSKLTIYRDAGHGFVFEDAVKWAKHVNKFLR